MRMIWKEEMGAWGLVDSSGAFFVAPQFREVKEFSGGGKGGEALEIYRYPGKPGCCTAIVPGSSI